MTFEIHRVAASLTLACTLALPPAGARAAAPGDATTPEPAPPAAAHAEPSADGERSTEVDATAPAPAKSEAKTSAPIPPPRPVAEDKVDAPVESVRTCFERGRDVCRNRRILGGVSLALGLASAGAGVALTLVNSKTISDDPSFERAYLPAGLVLIGASTLLVTMGAMLLGDAVQRKRGAKARFAWRTR